MSARHRGTPAATTHAGASGHDDAASARGSRAGAGGWQRLTGAASAPTLAFCLLTFACVLVAVGGPRLGAQVRAKALSQLTATAPTLTKDVIGTTDASTLATGMHPSSTVVTAADMSFVQGDLRRKLRAQVPLASAQADWGGMTTPSSQFTGGAPQPGHIPAVLELAYRSSLSRHARLVAGTMPVTPVNGGPDQIAITQAFARQFGLHPGSQITVAGLGHLKVSGILAAVRPSDLFWQIDPLVAAPALIKPQGQPPYWEAGAFIAAGSAVAVESQFNASDVQLTWAFPLAIDHITPAQATQLAGTLSALLGPGEQLVFGGFQNVVDVNLASGVLGLLATFTSQSAAISRIVDLMAGSLTVVAAVIILLAAWLLAERRREAFAIMRARGASRRQLAITIFGGAVVAALPGAIAGGVLAAVLTGGGSASLSWWLGGLTLLTALAGPVLITVGMHRGYAAGLRPDRPPSRRAAIRRGIAEVALLLAAAGGLAALHQQQVSGSGVGDLYASSVPILVAVPVAIVLLRLYPLAARLLLWLAGRRRGATAFIGLARAARVSATAVLPAFAMVLALSLVSFGGMVRGAIARGEVTQSWVATGADAVVAVPGALTATQQRDLAAVPGVDRTALVAVTNATLGLGGAGMDVMLANPRQYAAFAAATALPRPPASFASWRPHAGGTVPVLASAALAARLGPHPVSLDLGTGTRLSVEVAGGAPAMSKVPAAGPADTAGLLVLPAGSLTATDRAGAPAGMLLMAGSGLNQPALRATMARLHLGAAQLQLRSSVLASLEQAPLQRSATLELALGSVAAAIGCLLVLLLLLLLTAQSRQLTLARSATMGMSPAQSRWLALIESAPLLVSVLIGGVASALMLAPLVGPDLSLAVFTGASVSVPVRPEPAWLAGSAIALLLLAAVILTGQAAVAGRGIARSLRIGA